MKKTSVGKLYDDIYEKLDNDHEKILKLITEEKQSPYSIEETEKLGRMELALQTAKDIMENIMAPGTSMKIMHSKGSLTIEIDKKQHD
ncbi:hypothetical protein [Metabacillus sp. RGM 3146]|uniref:hypothetical protein n=1 Tax=Metabacillus sp. RGM 3146 TaxID=3401092 RepID=UPI003B9D2065